MPSPITQNRTFFRDETPRALGRATFAGTQKKARGLPKHPLRVFGQYALVLLVDGGGVYRDALGFKTSLQRGDLIWVFPEIPHFYGPSHGQTWDEIYVCFSGPIFDLWRREKILDSSRPVSTIEDWRGAFEKLQSWCEAPRESDALRALMQLHDFLAILASLSSPASTQSPPNLMNRAQSLLQSNLGEPLSPEKIARDLGMGYESFRKQFALQTGFSPARFRDLARIEAAKTLLLRGELSQKTIAQSLGFRDEAHFSRRFRELTSQAPREFRQKNSRPEERLPNSNEF